MMKQAIATTVFAAGTMLAGAAAAQTQIVTVEVPPVAHVANNGHVGNGGYVAPHYTEQVTVAETRQAEPVLPGQTAWESSTGGIENPNATDSEKYTFALNDLYANGFHNVRQLSMQQGMVYARAVSPYDTEGVVHVNPGDGAITIG